RPVTVHGRAGQRTDWTRHASGYLAPQPAPAAPEPPAAWPPEGAEPVEPAELYALLAGQGFDYGPLFTGVSALWRRGEEVFAEVALPEEAAAADATAAFTIHPALLDATLHGGELFAADNATTMPFAWRGVTLHATGATALRVR